MATQKTSGQIKDQANFLWDASSRRWIAQGGSSTGSSFITITPPSIVVSGQNTITASGTAEPIAGSATPVLAVNIHADEDNTGLLYVGDSGVDSTNGRKLRRNADLTISISDLNTIYVDADVNGEGYSYVAVKT